MEDCPMRFAIWTPPLLLLPPPHVNAMKLQCIPILDCIDIIVNNNDDIWIEYSLRFPSLLSFAHHALEDPHKVSLLQLIRSAKRIESDCA